MCTCVANIGSAHHYGHNLQTHVTPLSIIFFDQELISYRYSPCCCSCWGDHVVVSKRIWIKFGGIVLQVNTHRSSATLSSIFCMMSHAQDGGHDVISHRKVLPSGECTRSVLPQVPDPLYIRTCIGLVIFCYLMSGHFAHLLPVGIQCPSCLPCSVVFLQPP